MRKFRSLVALAATFTLSLFASGVATSQEKPVALVSIAPLDKVLQDFTYLMRACGVGQFGGIGSNLVKQWADGLDFKRPSGAMVQLIDGQPVPLIFLPLDNRKTLFDALAGAGQFPDDLGGGLFAFDVGGRTVYAKDAGKWLFISQQEDDLKKLPADPSALLGDAPTKYDLGIRINLQALPAELRGAAVEQMKQGFERSLAEQRGQTDEEKAAAEEMGKASIKQMERLINETEQVLIGLATGPSIQKLQLDVAAQFVSGSELAKQVDQLNGLTSDFTGLLIDDAAMTVRSTSLVSEGDKAMGKNNIRSALSQIEKQIDDSGSLPTANKEAIKKFSKGLVAVLEKTIDGGKFDGGGAVSLSDNKVRAVFGGYIADGKQVEKDVKALVASMDSTPDAKFEFNYAKHQSVDLHKVTIAIKSDDAQVKKVLGNELKLVIGTGDKILLVSLDPDGDALIKSALDRLNSKKGVKVIPGEMILKAGQVLSFAQSVAPNPILEAVSAAIEKSEGKDKLKVTTTR